MLVSRISPAPRCTISVGPRQRPGRCSCPAVAIDVPTRPLAWPLPRPTRRFASSPPRCTGRHICQKPRDHMRVGDRRRIEVVWSAPAFEQAAHVLDSAHAPAHSQREKTARRRLRDGAGSGRARRWWRDVQEREFVGSSILQVVARGDSPGSPASRSSRKLTP